MKTIFFMLLIGMPFFGFGQVSDSVSVVHELDSLVLLNYELIRQRKLDEALTIIEEVEKKAKLIFGDMNAIYAKHVFYHARTLSYMGEYNDAAILYLKSKDIRAIVLGKENLNYLRSTINLANQYMQMGDFHKAEDLYLEAKGIFITMHEEAQPDYAGCLNNLATLYKSMGVLDKAEAIYVENVELRAKILGENHSDYASSLFNLAIVYIKMGQNSKAEFLLLKALDIQAKVLGKQHTKYASTLSSLGILYSQMGMYDKVEPLLLETMEIQAKTLGKEHLFYSYDLTNLANYYHETGEYAKSEQLHKEALVIIEKLLGKKHSDYATILTNIARLYQDMGKYSDAEQFFLQAKEIQENTLGKEHSEYLATLNGLSYFYWRTGQILMSKNYIKQAAEIQHTLLRNSTRHLSEQEIFKYAIVFSKDLDHYYSFAQKNNSYNDISSLCFNNNLFYNGFVITTVSQIKRAALSDKNASNSYNTLTDIRRNLSREYSKPITERDSAQLVEWEEKANALEKELVRTIAGYGDLARQVSWEEVKKKLSLGTAAIEFISYRYYTPKPTDSVIYAALVLLPSDTTPHFIPLFEERQLQALLNRPGLSEKLVLKDLYGNSPELRHLIWDPIEPLLRDVKTIYYSPSGLLHRINPGAILDESNQPLSDGRQWVRLGSTRELVTGRLADRSFALSSEENSNSTLTALVYGGITYDMDSLAFARANPIGAIDSTEMPLRKDGAFSYIIGEQPDASNTRGSSDGTWSTLAATNKEADEVSAMLTGAGFSTQKRQGFYASEEQFKQIGVSAPSPRVLHLATHGFSYPDPKKTPPKGFADSEPTYKMLDDPMLRSGLVLAGANYYWKNKRPLTNREDGVLVAYEVRDLNLRNTELAVLSACQTGLGDVVGSEGVYGLQRAFKIAGAKFLIVSLWQVPDEQTQELMRLFYQNWLEKKESLRDAFNHAQQALREKEPNPFMWAGFVLVE